MDDETVTAEGGRRRPARVLGTADWQALNGQLDVLLDMTEPDRGRWLADLARQDPGRAADLAALLQENAQLEREGFLATSPGWPRLATPTETPAGRTVGAYTLVSPLGSGGMGTVWLGRRSDGQYAGEVAVKLLNVALAGDLGVERFRREASILARLAHPHIARLIDAGVTSDGQPYLLLERVDGERIDHYCDGQRSTVEQRLQLVLDVLAALAHAHASLIVHRDIKPSNVLVSRSGQVKLVDFGIAKLIGPEAEATLLTRDGTPVTPAFAAPEQLTGGEITTATDVYGVGVLAYLLITGRHPTGQHESAADLLRATLDTEPAPMWKAVQDATGELAEQRQTTSDRLQRALRTDLDTILAKALRKKPEERYVSASALADDIRRYLGNQPILARPLTRRYRARKFVRRHRATVALAAVAVGALLGGLAGIALQARDTARQRDRALEQLVRADTLNEFTQSLLGQVVPGNQPVPMREILERGERLVSERFAPDDPAAVDILVTIGSIYVIRDESDNAQRVLERAYKVSQRATDPGVRAHAQCAWGRAIGEKDLAKARLLVDEAIALLPSETRFDGVAADCMLSQGSLAMDAGDTEMVVRAGRAGLARLDARPGVYPEVRVGLLQLLAVAHYMRGETGEADRAFDGAFAELKRTGRAEGTDAAVLLHNWARNVAATSPLDALAMNARVAEIFKGQGPDSVPLPSRLNYTVQLNRLARHAEALATARAARDDARRHDNPTSLGLANLQIGWACRALQDLPCARNALGEAEAAFKGALPPGHRAFADLARERGLLAAAERRPDEARRELTSAIELHRAGSDNAVARCETLIAAARFELSDGRLDAADGHARAALELAERLRGGAPHSAWVGLSRLTAAEIRQARGDVAGARDAYTGALADLTATLGEAHPSVAEARGRLGAGSSASTGR